MAENIIRIKFIEVPYGITLQDKLSLLNIWITDMQRNGINIISTSNIMRQENPDGTITEGFQVEYREMN